jgi:phospholipid/cholesterol/gamma-HCH transport system substrate-binding protein
MNERRMQFAVGVVTLGSVFIAAVLMMINSPIPGGLSPFGRSQYPLTIKLDKAPGVARDTPVRKNGVLIGRVTDVKDAADGEKVDVFVNVDEGPALTTHHTPHVRTSVLGDAVIDFEVDEAKIDQPRRNLAPDDEVTGKVVPNPIEAISKLTELQPHIERTMDALTAAGKSVDELAKQVRGSFGTDTDPGRVRRLIDRTDTAMFQFGNAMASINQIFGDDPIRPLNPVQAPLAPGQQPAQQPSEGEQLRMQLRQGLRELPLAVSEFRNAIRSADENLNNLKGFTQPLGERGPQIAQSIIDAVNGLDKLVEEFTLLATALNNREGTIGQLIHNRQLYENLNRLTINANEVLIVVYRLAERLRPVVEDARTFMNKIALEPGRIFSGAVGEPSVVK